MVKKKLRKTNNRELKILIIKFIIFNIIFMPLVIFAPLFNIDWFIFIPYMIAGSLFVLMGLFQKSFTLPNLLFFNLFMIIFYNLWFYFISHKNKIIRKWAIIIFLIYVTGSFIFWIKFLSSLSLS